jgi:hypothetical protein
MKRLPREQQHPQKHHPPKPQQLFHNALGVAWAIREKVWLWTSNVPSTTNRLGPFCYAPERYSGHFWFCETVVATSTQTATQQTTTETPTHVKRASMTDLVPLFSQSVLHHRLFPCCVVAICDLNLLWHRCKCFPWLRLKGKRMAFLSVISKRIGWVCGVKNVLFDLQSTRRFTTLFVCFRIYGNN